MLYIVNGLVITELNKYFSSISEFAILLLVASLLLVLFTFLTKRKFLAYSSYGAVYEKKGFAKVCKKHEENKKDAE